MTKSTKNDDFSDDDLQCPCCDYFTFTEKFSYDICPICFWEEDGLDIDNIEQHSGPNHLSIKEARLNFKKYGACDKSMIKNVISVSERKKYKLVIRKVS